MGWGDDLMWLGEAEQVHKENPDAVITDGQGFSSAWENISWVVPPSYKGNKKVIKVPGHKNGLRWYCEAWLPKRCILIPYTPKIAPYVVTDEEKESIKNKIVNAIGSKNFILLNPDSKTTFFSTNKSWPLEYWNSLAKKLTDAGFTCVRARPVDPNYKVEPLENCVEIPTNSLREAVALLSLSDCIVTTEGGMHHSAAATGTKAFVIVGGHSSPDSTGYKETDQVYYTYDHYFTPCGMRVKCRHCREGMAGILPETVERDILDFFGGVRRCKSSIS